MFDKLEDILFRYDEVLKDPDDGCCAIVRIISRLKNDAISSIPPAGTAIACREGCGRRSRRRARSGNSTE